ncbi:MAG: NAD(P)/FAD-dependent oxidoreductase [Chromatiales bacterium]|nr:NAD(P)/FAD-dependent oxidoreductase [Chromatiales bacterium]
MVSGWIEGFDKAVRSGDSAALEALLSPDGHWRDVLAFTWHYTTLGGASEISRAMATAIPRAGGMGFELNVARTPPRLVRRAGATLIEAIFRFETTEGRGSGVLRLVPHSADEGRYVAWTVLTALDELKGWEDKVGERRPRGDSYSRNFGGDNWQDLRDADRAYDDHDPTVIVVGGGQAGLAIAARLRQLDVDTLIVERHERIGDNWRKRYHSLTLHNEVHVNHLPYMPFPETWPAFIPKDKLAGWFEAYVEAMELNAWTSTAFLGGDYDDAANRWRVRLRRADGSERIMHPRHVIMAVGVSGLPQKPDLSGLERFGGSVVHSGNFESGAPWAGKNALVLGTGNSGHDVAQDLHAHGARTTLIQRSPTTVASVEPSGLLVYGLYAEGPSTDDCDLITVSVPYPLLERSFELLLDVMKETDKETLNGLRQVGFKLDEVDRTGFQMKYLRRGGGYYLDVGCSGLIIDGEIGLMHFDDVDEFCTDGVRMKDGRTVPADLLVLATGYLGQEELLRLMFGDTVADRAGPVWGFDEEGELRNMWKRTGQPGLWFIAGSLAQCRIYSKYLALQIKACEEGLIPLSLERDIPSQLSSARG